MHEQAGVRVLQKWGVLLLVVGDTRLALVESALTSKYHVSISE